jgi:hypothetical protein
VQRKVPDSSLLVTGSARCWKLGESRRASYSLESSSVANVGLARAEESARQPADGTWDQLAAHAGNWEKAGGHRTLANGIISWKQWFSLVGSGGHHTLANGEVLQKIFHDHFHDTGVQNGFGSAGSREKCTRGGI